MGNRVVDIRELEARACQRFWKCPKHTTVVRAADLENDSEFHCVPVDPDGSHLTKDPKKHHFTVPEQEVIMVEDGVYGLFSIIRVLDPRNNQEYALVISVHSRMGFSVPIEKFPADLLQMETQTDS